MPAKPAPKRVHKQPDSTSITEQFNAGGHFTFGICKNGHGVIIDAGKPLFGPSIATLFKYIVHKKGQVVSAREDAHIVCKVAGNHKGVFETMLGQMQFKFGSAGYAHLFQKERDGSVRFVPKAP
jgi:hypothetical protein